MTPYYQDDYTTIYHGDCREVLPTLGRVDAVVTDPPYNIGKAEWDKIPNYLQWCESWISAASKGCKRQGAFWCFHSEPMVLADIARIIEGHGRPMQNWVTWDKDKWTYCRKYKEAGSRRFIESCEYAVYHADDGQWTAQSDECRGFIFEPLRAYLAGERDRAGIDNATINAAWCAWKGVSSTSQTQKWFSNSCFNPPTAEAYQWLRELFNKGGGEYLRREYEDLRREYEDLRREYEHLRPTFNNPGKVSSVWQYPPAPANGHATPKPLGLMERIIAATTNPGDLVLDCFGGSGTTGVAAQRLRRKAVLIELDESSCEIAANRLTQGILPLFTPTA